LIARAAFAGPSGRSAVVYAEGGEVEDMVEAIE
jgi:hypothetical protein